jgi:serine/threonine-protein kinase
MSQLIGTSRPTWIPERSPRWVVRWSNPIDDGLLASRMVAKQFFQDGTVVSGFDRATLPEFPARTAGAIDTPITDAP